LLFPHIVILMILLPVSAVFLVYSMIFLGTSSVTAIISYVLAFYTLTVWCLRIPDIINFVKRIKNENKYVRIWRSDPRIRVNISLHGALIWNIAYAFLQFGLGIYHNTFWFCSLSAYYLSLAVMRLFLSRHTRRNDENAESAEKMIGELSKYRTCGIIFLIMNIFIALMTFFMVYWNRTFHHHEITTIAMAAYTFTSFTLAIMSMVRYRKYNSPVYSASKAISLASACVSMLTLESTMLTTFGDGTMTLFERRILLGVSGGAISAFIITMAIMMIVKGSEGIKAINTRKYSKGSV